MHYCGVVPVRDALQLAIVEEVRATEPPIRLSVLFFEPGSPVQVVTELRSLGDVVVGVGAPLTEARDGRARRGCDDLLARLGVAPPPPASQALELARLVAEFGAFSPAAPAPGGAVADGAYRDQPLFETSADAVFCALQGRLVPARRHPLGVQVRIAALAGGRLIDDGGDLWHRRIEELDAAACALCAHRYAVGHACWLGDPAEAVIVLPGSSLPEQFTQEGVMPPVERLKLPALEG